MAREHDFFSGLGAANELGELAFGLGDGYAHDLQSQDNGRAIHSSMVHFNRMRTRGPTRLIRKNRVEFRRGPRHFRDRLNAGVMP